MSDLPHAPNWRVALDKARQTRRCGAKTRSGGVCNGMAMTNGRCRMHGGASTGAVTDEGKTRSRRGNWSHGYRSARFLAFKREIAENSRKLREMMRASDRALRYIGR